MHYGEEPGAHIGTVLPQVGLRECAQEGVLHKIVCSIVLPRQGPCVATKAGDLVFDEAVKLAHSIRSQCCDRSQQNAKLYTPNVIP
jgi:hypothetical protein